MDSKIGVWGKRVKDPNPQTRVKAVEALELIGDPEALGVLAEVFATDSDPQIRQLAQKAGKAIYYNLHRQVQMSQADDTERRRAAQILAQAQARKQHKG